MTATQCRGRPGSTEEEEGDAPADAFARWLGLAAAPAFAVMALLTGICDAGRPDVLCAKGHALTLGGMVPMYALMSAVHATPWLKLASRRCRLRW